MMSLVIQSSAMGKKEATIREISPNKTTSGPDSQTIRKVGGTFRSADIRCRQLVVEFVVFSVTRPLIYLSDSLANKCADMRCKNLIWSYPRGKAMNSKCNREAIPIAHEGMLNTPVVWVVRISKISMKP
jgi:hypothetical protein